MRQVRVSIRQIPNWATQCDVPRDCPYRDNQKVCDEPRTNKGNSDSACHTMINKYLLAALVERGKAVGDE